MIWVSHNNIRLGCEDKNQIFQIIKKSESISSGWAGAKALKRKYKICKASAFVAGYNNIHQIPDIWINGYYCRFVEAEVWRWFLLLWLSRNGILMHTLLWIYRIPLYSGLYTMEQSLPNKREKSQCFSHTFFVSFSLSIPLTFFSAGIRKIHIQHTKKAQTNEAYA